MGFRAMIILKRTDRSIRSETACNSGVNRVMYKNCNNFYDHRPSCTARFYWWKSCVGDLEINFYNVNHGECLRRLQGTKI